MNLYGTVFSPSANETPRTEDGGLDGNTIVPEIAPHSCDIVIRKHKPGAFFGTPLLSFLVQLGVDRLLLAGTTTSGCVRATAVDAFSNNYRVAVFGRERRARGVECRRGGNDFGNHRRTGSVSFSFPASYFKRYGRWTSSAKSVFQFDVQGSVAKSSTHAGIPWLKRIYQIARYCYT